MKKNLLLFIPIIALAGCNANDEVFAPYIEYRNGIAAVVNDESEHVTYLMMSPFGSLKVGDAPIKGNVNELYYENTIIWEAAPGTKLPGKDDVISSVEGATFRGWYFYNEDNTNVFPDLYTEVPAQNGLALKAIFDGKEGGGGGGQEDPTEGYGLIFSDGTKIVGAYQGISDQTGKPEYLCANVSFTTGQVFSLYDFSTQASWVINVDGWSFGGKSADDTTWKTYLSKGDSAYTVRSNFTADVYIKLEMGNDEIYFGLK